MLRLLLIVLLLACAPETPARDDASAPRCEQPRHVARLPDVLHEASGVAISRRHPGILWVHNDSGDPVIFAVDTLGRLRARIELDVPNLDWEDVAVAPCPEGSCLYIGAIGDNRQARADREVLRLPEPALTARRAPVLARLRYRLPDQAHDAEALFVLPDQRIFLITKGRSGPVTVYRFPQPVDTGGVNELTVTQTLTPGLVQLPDMITGAAATPDGRVIALRTYSALQLYTLTDDQLVPYLRSSGVDLQPLREPQGEGIDIRSDGAVFLVSEQGLEASATLSRAQCVWSAQ